VSSADPIAAIAEAPDRTALLFDVDGTLAPIVERPEDARIPDSVRGELERLARKYALVAFVSGRASDDARQVVGLPELVYVGSHGLELAPDVDRWRTEIKRFASGIDWPVEDKGLSVSFHYRGVEDEAAAEATLRVVADEAREAGLRARFGRKVLEVLPPVDADKGTAVRTLLEERGLRRALYAGDDTTDLDAFAALDRLELGVRLAVSSAEAPPALIEAADVVVDSPQGVFAVLQRL
jgi:trehalose 6-phosphate phosphatase